MSFHDRPYYRDEPQAGFMSQRLSGHSMVTWLLAINIIVFVLDAILTGSRRAAMASPSYWGAFDIERGVYGLQLWRWITYQFIHADFFHILFNMIGLFFFGRLMEAWWGSRRFLAFYLLCGTVGAVLYTVLALSAPGVIFPPDAEGYARVIPLVGASGSIFGILIGCAVLYPHQRVMLLFPPIPMSMRTLATVFLAISALSLVVGSRSAASDAVHLGGALLGFVLVKNPDWLNWAERLGMPRPKLGSGRWERRMRREEERLRREQDEVDRILAKVKDHGLHSLTRREKRVLQHATDRQRRAG